MNYELPQQFADFSVVSSHLTLHGQINKPLTETPVFLAVQGALYDRGYVPAGSGFDAAFPVDLIARAINPAMTNTPWVHSPIPSIDFDKVTGTDHPNATDYAMLDELRKIRRKPNLSMKAAHRYWLTHLSALPPAKIIREHPDAFLKLKAKSRFGEATLGRGITQMPAQLFWGADIVRPDLATTRLMIIQNPHMTNDGIVVVQRRPDASASWASDDPITIDRFLAQPDMLGIPSVQADVIASLQKIKQLGFVPANGTHEWPRRYVQDQGDYIESLTLGINHAARAFAVTRDFRYLDQYRGLRPSYRSLPPMSIASFMDDDRFDAMTRRHYDWLEQMPFAPRHLWPQGTNLINMSGDIMAEDIYARQQAKRVPKKRDQRRARAEERATIRAQYAEMMQMGKVDVKKELLAQLKEEWEEDVVAEWRRDMKPIIENTARLAFNIKARLSGLHQLAGDLWYDLKQSPAVQNGVVRVRALAHRIK